MMRGLELKDLSRPCCAQVRTGNSDGALAAVSGLSALLNTDPTTQSRRRARQLLASTGGARRTLEEMKRAGQRESLLGVVADVVEITAVPTPTVRGDLSCP